MKLTKDAILNLIEEALEHSGESHEQREAEYVSKETLKGILKRWEKKEYKSPTHRFEEYFKDIKKLVEEPIDEG